MNLANADHRATVRLSQTVDVPAGKLLTKDPLLSNYPYVICGAIEIARSTR